MTMTAPWQDNDNDNDDQHEHEHDVPGQRISSPDYVDVEIPQSVDVAPSQQSPVSSTSSEGYPSWLQFPSAPHLQPQVPPRTQEGQQPAPAMTVKQQQMPVPFSDGCKPTPHSVRIVSMQDSNAATTATDAGTGGTGAGGRREPGTDRTTTTMRTPDARLRADIATPPKFRTPGLHLELPCDPSYKTGIHFYLFPILVLAHLPLQTFLDFNAIYILIELQSSQIRTHPEFPAVVVTGSWALLHTLRAGSSGYSASFLAMRSSTYYRRWRFRRPIILPIYLFSLAFNFVAMLSYDHFCFLQHIRSSAFPYVNSSAILPLAEGSLRDALAETCYFYAQNLPTIVTLLSRAGLAFALLLSFFSPENLPAHTKGVLIANAAWAAWKLSSSCSAGSVSGYSAGMAVRGSVGLAHAGRRKNEMSAERSSEGGFEGIENIFAAVGLSGAAQPQPARRGMLSRDLFESPSGPPSRRSSVANGHGNEGDKNAPLENLPYPFLGFGPRDSSEQEQIPFPPSPAVPEESAGSHYDDEVEVEGDIVVEVEDEGEEEEEEEEINPRSSEEPSSFSGRASNSLSSLGQPIPSHYPFAFRHPARVGSMPFTGSPPFAFSRATATPQSKSTSTGESHETRSTGNMDTTTASSSPSGGSPTSSVPSSQDPIWADLLLLPHVLNV
ncbi:hypothetical protein F5888DRAFT_1906594 [Russula emetica]|nr:hypothetical protein F5888DRAFT_1906594 [Russula emetica]